ncbi:hypothetical protein DW886_20090 [Enterocloster aldenensis]|uniref:hypothetical protein n=1 Tax=Enterocloster aldenensis TaxID=358742 RepID=UPI000E50ED2F|nr:hypothetical protein DW886_20090 [Enterocloster aldenensis]
MKLTKLDWLTNIENSIAAIGNEDIADSVLSKHGAVDLEKLSVAMLSDIWNELYAIEVDLR